MSGTKCDSNCFLLDSQVWLTVELSNDGRVYFGADSDSEVTRGLCALLLQGVNGTTAEELLAVPLSVLKGLRIGVESQSRANTWSNVLLTLQKRTSLLIAKKAGLSPVEPFPSLLITADNVVAQGAFAKAQVSHTVKSVRYTPNRVLTSVIRHIAFSSF